MMKTQSKDLLICFEITALPKRIIGKDGITDSALALQNSLIKLKIYKTIHLSKS